MITFEIIGNRIKERREAIEMNQIELVHALEVQGCRMSIETIGNIEEGSRAMNVMEIKAICEILGVSCEMIMKEEVEEDLANALRSKGVIMDAAMEEISNVQDYIKDLIMQRQIAKAEFLLKKITPSWRSDIGRAYKIHNEDVNH